MWGCLSHQWPECWLRSMQIEKEEWGGLVDNAEDKQITNPSHLGKLWCVGKDQTTALALENEERPCNVDPISETQTTPAIIHLQLQFTAAKE